MMMCCKCKKRPAVVFMSGMNGNQRFDNGYCLVCAKEIGIPQVNEYLKQMGISEDDFENGMNMLFGGSEIDEIDMETEISEDEDEENDEDSVDGFKSGGAGTMPAFLQSIFGGNKDSGKQSDNGADNTEKNEKSAKKKSKENKKREEVHPAVHIGIHTIVLVHHGIHHHAWLLCGGPIVQIHQRLAIYFASQDGEIFSYLIYIVHHISNQ